MGCGGYEKPTSHDMPSDYIFVPIPGDFTGDGLVDVADLGVLATHYGETADAVVPEPSTFATLLGLCLAGLLVSPRRRVN